jgi:hypothetical protein
MIGNQLTAFQLNTLAGAAAVGLRDACQTVLNLQATLVALGTAGLEAAPISLDSTDAASVVEAVNYLNTVALAFFGQATIPTEFNFNTEVAPLYGGQ